MARQRTPVFDATAPLNATALLDATPPLDATALLDATAPSCAPIDVAPLSERDADELSGRLRALADPARLRLMSLLLASPGQEACVCDLTEPVGLSQPTVSHHLKVLVDAGLLVRTKRGRWTDFRVVPGALGALATLLSSEAT